MRKSTFNITLPSEIKEEIEKVNTGNLSLLDWIKSAISIKIRIKKYSLMYNKEIKAMNNKKISNKKYKIKNKENLKEYYKKYYLNNK